MSDERETERQRIRAKMSEQDRKFMDSFKQLFPNSRLVGIKFSDGETIGRLK
jgi:hypothetical protein